MNYLGWYAGMKVVCIDPTWGTNGGIQKHFCPNLPERGRIYTIRSLECRKVVNGCPPEVLVRLVEVTNPRNHQGEPVFFASKFRPVQPRETDISVFTAFLTEAKGRVKKRVPA